MAVMVSVATAEWPSGGWFADWRLTGRGASKADYRSRCPVEELQQPGWDMQTRLTNASSVPSVTGLGGVENADQRYAGRQEVRLAKSVGITQFGVNHVTLEPGAFSANRHWHEAEDEFVCILSGSPSLYDENGKHQLKAGDIIGFPAGEPNAHHIVNDSDEDASIMVVGSRKPGQETIHYPDDDFGPSESNQTGSGHVERRSHLPCLNLFIA